MNTQIGTLSSKKSFSRTVAALVVPIAIQNLINVAVQGADVIMLGQLDEISISAASLAGQVQFVLILVLFGLASGASVLTAQYWGKGNIRAIEKVMSIALRISFVTSLIFFAAVNIAPVSIMQIFSPEEAVVREGAAYLRYVSPSYLIISFTVVYLNILRSVEKVIISTITYSITLFANIGFNSVLIFGLFGMPKMGAAGAALGTSLARIVELAIVAIYAKTNKTVRLKIKDFVRWHSVLLKDFRKYSLTTTFNELVWSLGITAYAVIIGHLGAQVVAANSVAQVIRQLATVVSFGVANASAVLIGKALVANAAKTALNYAKRMMRLAFITGAIGSVVILALRPFITNMVNLPPKSDEYLLYIMLLMSVYVIFQAINATAIVGVFRGGGDIRIGIILDSGTMWGFGILLGLLGAFVLNWPVWVLLVIVMLDEVIKLPFCIWRYKSKKWMKNVTRAEIGD
jgi:putative MATE family efflux protein